MFVRILKNRRNSLQNSMFQPKIRPKCEFLPNFWPFEAKNKLLLSLGVMSAVEHRRFYLTGRPEFSPQF